MQLGCKKWVLTLVFAISALPVYGAIEGDYSGNFQTGIQGGGAFSYVHTAESFKMGGDANYLQQAGGKILFAMDVSDTILLSIEDVGPAGFGVGDLIKLKFEVDLLKFNGFGADNDGSLTPDDVVATLKLEGNLTVGGASKSSLFDYGLRNITDADTSSSFGGLKYTIELNSDFSIDTANTFFEDDIFAGDAFFQSAAFAGPFNGVSYDDITNKLTFAIWGDSRNMDGRSGSSVNDGNPNNTGLYDAGGLGSTVEKALGFDIYIEATMIPAPGTGSVVPEASSILVWSLLTSVGLISLRRRGSVSV